MNRICSVAIAVMMGGAAAAPVMSAQVVAAVPPRSADMGVDHVLTKLVTVRLDDVSVQQAIDALVANAGVHAAYRAETIRAVQKSVTLHARKLSLGAALDSVLAGTQLQAQAIAADVVKIASALDKNAQVAGSITGRVTHGKTGQPVRSALVTLDDSAGTTRTADDGTYRFSNVAASAHRVTVRALGFIRKSQMVTVADEQTAVLNFAIESSANTLDQVVVTATGEQRIRELGHVVAKINVDSLVREAPITSVSDLLQSRIPGLQVLTGNGGMAGGEVGLRLRGTSTFKLDPEPIVIVNGIRYRSNNLIRVGSTVSEDRRGARETELQSPLNDLNPNDIETIEVVKGPSASTLYGPDAANGVIVITTKQGVPGKTEFRWYARPVSNAVPRSTIDRAYRAWGHDESGEVYTGGNCTLMNQYYDHSCTLDSITPVRSIADNDQYTVLAKSRPTWQYGASVRGGSQLLRYFLSANYNSQVGVLQIPPAAQRYLKEQLGVSKLADAIRNPNTLQVASLNTNVTRDIAWRGHVSATLNYARTNHRTIDASTFVDQVRLGALQPTQDTTQINTYLDPTFSLLTTEEHSDHFTGAVNGTVQPFSWLSANASAGLDLNGTVTHSILPSDVQYTGSLGFAIDDRRDNMGSTLTLGTTAVARSGVVSFRSSLGTQYSYQRLDGLRSSGFGLAPGSTSIATASSKSVDQLWSEIASLGTYGEEVIGFNDRIFLTGSLRLDGSTSFGDAYKPRPYPKIGMSWILSDEPFLKATPGLRELRLRASLGSASRYPTSEMKLGRVDGYGTTVQGSTQNIFDRGELANPLLRPERTREVEYGGDMTVLSNVIVGLTWYTRRTNDQLQPFGNNNSGLPQYWANIASLKSHGFELTATVPLIDAKSVHAEMLLAYSNRIEKVVSLGAGVENKSYDGGGYAIGYPIGSAFGYRILGVADTVGGHADGITFPQEVIRDTVLRFLGVLDPPKTYTATPTVTFGNGRLRFSALFDRATGFLRYNPYGYPLDQFLASTPLIRQARYARQYNGEDFLESGDFTRWREMNISVDVPQRFLRVNVLHLAFSRASVSLQGRNLAIWTKYQGSDPESQDKFISSAQSNGIPQARMWSVRFDITP